MFCRLIRRKRFQKEHEKEKEKVKGKLFKIEVITKNINISSPRMKLTY